MVGHSELTRYHPRRVGLGVGPVPRLARSELSLEVVEAIGEDLGGLGQAPDRRVETGRVGEAQGAFPRARECPVDLLPDRTRRVALTGRIAPIDWWRWGTWMERAHLHRAVFHERLPSAAEPRLTSRSHYPVTRPVFPAGSLGCPMKVLLRNPRRELDVAGPITVTALLQRLDLSPESVLVIAGDELVAKDARLDDTTTVEIRPVISGGQGPLE